MRHDADDVAALVADASDIVRRAVGVLEVAQHDAPFFFQLRERLRIGEVVPLVVGDGEYQLFAGITARRPWRVDRFDANSHTIADKAHMRISEQSARQEVRLGQDLEAVTDAEYRTALLRELFEGAHDVREAGDRAGSEVITVGEAAGDDHGVDTLEISVSVPQLDRLNARPLYTIKGVPVAVGSGEDRNAYPHPTTSHSYSSIVGLERSLRHMASTSSALSTSISTSLPTWTVLTPSKPRAGSAFFTASPCGSRMPAFGRTRTRIFNPPLPSGWPPMSLRKRSLSSFSPVSLSQKRQVSGEISSASMRLPSASRPASILKSTRIMPRSSKKGARVSLTLRPSSSQNSRSSSATPSSLKWYQFSRGSPRSSSL